MVTALIVVFVLLLAAAVVFVGAGDVLMAKLHSRGAVPEEEALPFLIVPVTHQEGSDEGGGPVPIGSAPRGDLWPTARTVTPVVSRPPVELDGERYDANWDGRGGGGRRERDGAPDEQDARTIIFRRPVDEPMQLLPGRLQVLAGEKGREEIRLFGGLGERPQITIGRDSGPPQRVVTLHSPTVSRRHARMEFVDGRWTITNLSRTNPVLVNDEVLSPNGGGVRVLDDGDRIELGEVVLRFRVR